MPSREAGLDWRGFGWDSGQLSVKVKRPTRPKSGRMGHPWEVEFWVWTAQTAAAGWARLLPSREAGLECRGSGRDRWSVVSESQKTHPAKIRPDGPPAIGIDTIYKSKGKIPEVFLRGCGVPDEFIAYIGSMVGRAIEFYSCFISYSSKDQEFAERLHADLQAKGVRCWFAPEDLKIGDRFQERIEESIRVHDKLLLVLSENSVVSPWVEREVQAAFEREHRSGKPVLFPIRVDEAVMEATQAWAADIRRTRHIGEFGNWREHESYKNGLERLLWDLKNSG